MKYKVFVVGDNIDTDQIIPAQYLNLVPTIPEEYEKLGSYALCGLPESYPRFIKEGNMKTEYGIIIAGKNFGCGSSREHAPICLGAAGLKYVVSSSFARIFFRNCISTGEVFPIESKKNLVEYFKTGDYAEISIEKSYIKNISSKEVFELKDLGAVKDVIEAGGIFNYARKNKMI
ncbi:MAG TPA: 3-isopropylmalate dehydratase [Victivallales bacterium]|nr:3-isopropylmalate dehydratase [Victivallales bacterium]HRU01439.1 3-isopropylmalate dehydratase [Victivallales bacterium]